MDDITARWTSHSPPVMTLTEWVEAGRPEVYHRPGPDHREARWRRWLIRRELLGCSTFVHDELAPEIQRCPRCEQLRPRPGGAWGWIDFG